MALRRWGEKRRCRDRVRTAWGPGGGADHRVLLVAEALKGCPALLQFALPALLVEGVRRFLLCAEAMEDLPAAPPPRYLCVTEVKRRVRRIWGGRTHASLQAGCGSRSGSDTPRHSNLRVFHCCSSRERGFRQQFVFYNSRIVLQKR